MLVLIEHGDVLTPEPVGTQSILIGEDRIWQIGNVDAKKLASLDLNIETLDARGGYVIPGLVDPHSNIAGAGGEQGFISRQPEVTWQDNALAGITTIVGCIGADAVARSLSAVLGKARQLTEQGLTCYVMTGDTLVPPTTITGRALDDLIFIPEMIAIGETAISDPRANEPTPHELSRICSEGIMGGNIAGKSGVTHFHVGPASRRLAPLRELLDHHDVPPKYVYPTHVTRTRELFDEAISLTRRGCFIDSDCVEEDVAKWVPYYFEHDGPTGKLTLSSDAQTPGATPANLHRTLVEVVKKHHLPLEQILRCFTTNAADAFALKTKGRLRVGADGDVVVLRKESLEVMHVVSRGNVLVKDGHAQESAFGESRMKKSANRGHRSKRAGVSHDPSAREDPSLAKSAAEKGPLVVIGGHEETGENDKREILREVVRGATSGKSKVVVATIASHAVAKELGEDYTRTFKSLGVSTVEVLDIRTRDQACEESSLRKLANASVIFFTGGDQLRITSQIGGTPLFRKMLEIHDAGGTIAGTSAGAAAVPETMLISGASEESPRVASLGMAPGLGLLKGVVVDSHFAERGRIGRLLAAVAQNPYNLGLGIDENTAIVVRNDREFHVLGTGAVYVIDGSRIAYSSLSERDPEGSLSIFDVSLHMLGHGDRFDLPTKRPTPAPEDDPRENGAS